MEGFLLSLSNLRSIPRAAEPPCPLEEFANLDSRGSLLAVWSSGPTKEEISLREEAPTRVAQFPARCRFPHKTRGAPGRERFSGKGSPAVSDPSACREQAGFPTNGPDSARRLRSSDGHRRSGRRRRACAESCCHSPGH